MTDTATKDNPNYESPEIGAYYQQFAAVLRKCDPVLNTVTNTITNYQARLIKSLCHATQPIFYEQTRIDSVVLRGLTHVVEDCIRYHEQQNLIIPAEPPYRLATMQSVESLGLQVIHELTSNDPRLRLDVQRRIDYINAIVNYYGGIEPVLLAKIALLAYDIHRKHFRHLHSTASWDIERNENKIMEMIDVLRTVLNKKGPEAALDKAYRLVSEDYGTGSLSLSHDVFAQIV